MAVKDLNSRNEDVAENQVDDKSDLASTKATATEGRRDLAGHMSLIFRHTREPFQSRLNI
jgi:hypothetical protein